MDGLSTPPALPRTPLGWLPFLWSRVLFPAASLPGEPFQWRSLLLLLVVPAVLLYPCTGFRLFEPDESRYAQIPLEMAQRGDLVRSTSEFLMHNGQWEAASAALGVHRHTLRNRIDRVSELLGRDMEAAHTRSEVWLALKAREVLGMDSLLPAEEPAGPGPDLGDEEAAPTADPGRAGRRRRRD